jgi:hypothetical protein
MICGLSDDSAASRAIFSCHVDTSRSNAQFRPSLSSLWTPGVLFIRGKSIDPAAQGIAQARGPPCDQTGQGRSQQAAEKRMPEGK